MSEAPPNNHGPEALSRREHQVWKWSSKGKTNWEIGGILGCSAETAKKHVLRICRKLNVPNRAAAAALYGQYFGSGFSDPSDPENPAAVARRQVRHQALIPDHRQTFGLSRCAR